MKKTLYTFLLTLTSIATFAQSGNVGIGTNNPNVSAILDISDAARGLLIPRITLASTTDAATITTPAQYLVVFNTATAGAAPNNVTPGLYYNAGTSGAPNWVRLQTKADNDWTKATTTATPAIKTDNQYITGYAGIGDFSTTNPLKNLHIKHTASTDGLLLQNTTGNIGSSTNIFFSTYADIVAGTNRPGAKIAAIDDNYSAHLTFSTKIPGADANAMTERVRVRNNGEVQVTNLAGTGTSMVAATSDGTLIRQNKFLDVTVHDVYVSSYESCSNCDKFIWFSRPGGSSGDDRYDNPIYEKNMWIAPYNGRIVSIRLGVDPTSSNGSVEISKGRIVFEHACNLPNGSLSYYTNMSNSGSSTYANVSNWNGGEYEVLCGSPSFTITSPNRGRFDLNEGQVINWNSKGSNFFSFTKGQYLAIGVSGEYIEDNSYHMTVVWEYEFDEN